MTQDEYKMNRPDPLENQVQRLTWLLEEANAKISTLEGELKSMKEFGASLRQFASEVWGSPS